MSIVVDTLTSCGYNKYMDKTNNSFSRVRALFVARRAGFAGTLRWAGCEGGDHVFTTATGSEVHVDLVTGRAFGGFA